MQKGLALIIGIVLVFFGALTLVPLFGITITISGFTLDRFFPVAFILIGLAEITIRPVSHWFWGLITILCGAMLLFQNLEMFPGVTALLDLRTVLIPAGVLLYGVTTLVSRE